MYVRPDRNGQYFMSTREIDLRGSVKPNHRSVLSASLRCVERGCLELVYLLRPFDSALLRRGSLAPEKAVELQRLVAELRSKIVFLAGSLGLERALQDPTQQAKSLTEAMASHVAEMYPDRLTEYGSVSDDLWRFLDEHVRDLRVTLDRIGRVIDRPVRDVRNIIH